MFGATNMTNYGGSANGVMTTQQEQDNYFKTELRGLMLKVRAHMMAMEPAAYTRFKEICKASLQ